MNRSAVVTAVRAARRRSTRTRSSPACAKRYGMTLAGGQGDLKGRIFRIGHIGWFDVFDIATALAAVELVADRARRGHRARRRGAAALEAYEQLVGRMRSSSGSRSPTRASSSCARGSTSTSTPIAARGDRRPLRRALVRSATKVTADLIDRAMNLKVIGRAGVGVDNVDVEAATRRGIVVANAPGVDRRLRRRAHDRPAARARAQHPAGPRRPEAGPVGARAKWGGVELAGKTLGVLGFGRIGQQVARRALGLEMSVVAYDPFVSAERFRELGVERLDTPDDVSPPPSSSRSTFR